MIGAGFFAGRHVDNTHVVKPNKVQVRRSSFTEPPAAAEELRGSSSRADIGRNQPATPSGRRRRASAAASSHDTPASSVTKKWAKTANSLVKELRDHRDRIAKAQSRFYQEPYVFTQDLVLEGIARKRLRTTPELMGTKGMGEMWRGELGAALLNNAILHERQEGAGQDGRATSDASDGDKKERVANETVTRTARLPPQLTRA